MAIKSLSRIFIYDNKELQDPNPKFSEDEVKKFYSGTYASLINAKVESREIKDDVMHITFSEQTGTKG